MATAQRGAKPSKHPHRMNKPIKTVSTKKKLDAVYAKMGKSEQPAMSANGFHVYQGVLLGKKTRKQLRELFS